VFLICGIGIGYILAINLNSNIPSPDFYNGYLSNNAHELRIIDLQALIDAKSIPIDNNDDPGRDPPDDYFGILGNLTYPLKDIDITVGDEIVVIIRPSINIKPDNLDAYISCNFEAIKQVKNELCYFYTAPGTTPLFYISIYRNGLTIIKDIGVFGLHLSKLSNEFKPVKMTRSENASTVACISNFDVQCNMTIDEYFYIINT
jgi:hypothetical protein